MRKKRAPAPCTRKGPSGFCRVINPDSVYAAISRYSSGRSSNSFLHSSEQKKYFFPANWVRNSDSLSSTLIPQTGSVVITPPIGEFVPLASTDSNDLSVLCRSPSDCPRSSFPAGNFFCTKLAENSSIPVHLMPTALLATQIHALYFVSNAK